MRDKQNPDVDWNTIEGYLFNPDLAIVEVVTLDKTNTLESIYDHLGCTKIDAVDLDGNHCVYVDDEGWLNLQRAAVLYRRGDQAKFLGGNALFLRTDNEGNTVSPLVPIKIAAKTFTAAQARLMPDVTTSSNDDGDTFVISQDLKISPVINEEDFTVKA